MFHTTTENENIDLIYDEVVERGSKLQNKKFIFFFN